MAASLISKIFFAFTVLKYDWGWTKVIRTVVFCLINYPFPCIQPAPGIHRPCLNSGTCVPVPSLISCWTGLGCRPGAHRASLEPGLQHPQLLLLTWPLQVPWTALAAQPGLQWLLPAPSAAHPACAAALCFATEGTVCAWDTFGSQLIPLYTAAPWHFLSWATTHQS